MQDHKIRNLLLGLFFDAIGMLSYLFPGIGEFLDIIWAPLAGWLMSRMYKGKVGQGAAVVTFIEEMIPGLDVIPTFTIMWFYTYILKTSKVDRVIPSK